MKKNIIFLILIAFIIHPKAQINNVFSSIEKTNDSLSTDIYFYQNGIFEIIMHEVVSDDIIFEFTISSGNYFVRNNQIVCKDWFNGFESAFCIKKDSIITLKSFNYLKITGFSKSKFKIYETPDLHYIGSANSSELRKRHKNNKPENYEFKIGTYENSEGFRIVLNNSNEYKVLFKNMVISKGNWIRIENELKLFDVDLGHSFYAVIKTNILISLMFPWNGKYTVFKILE